MSRIRVCYGVATISRMLKNIGLFCKRDLQKRPIFCKETYIFKHPTNRSHPILWRSQSHARVLCYQGITSWCAHVRRAAGVDAGMLPLPWLGMQLARNCTLWYLHHAHWASGSAASKCIRSSRLSGCRMPHNCVKRRWGFVFWVLLKSNLRSWPTRAGRWMC